MNLESQSSPRNAIVVANASLRLLPTELPIFQNPHTPGQGYPFDTLALSVLSVGEPIKVLKTSRDGAWVLVEDHNDLGWVLKRDIAFISKNFSKRYKVPHYVVITKDFTPIKNDKGEFLFHSRIGMIFPVIHRIIRVPVKSNGSSAKLVPVILDKEIYSIYPLAPTPNNFAALINRMIGKPYGWGGLYNLRDCSLTTQDLLLPFGILLPRNSKDQIKNGKQFALSSLSNKEKTRLILKKAKPFVTLIHLPGHIVLYLGEKNGQLFIFQNKWGIKTKDSLGNEGRAVIGKSNIVPLTFGAAIKFSTEDLLSGADSMTILTDS